ncbi:MAG: aldo/keto reductase, partial [Bacilli bacterium]|nr:aldo/keto reductase [Bacilli bacterium]
MQLFDQKRRFAFGCMRLPMKDNEVDIEQFKQMVDAFIQAGFTYFDTAHGYIEGKSELAIKEALSSRYPRDAYSLTNKLTEPYFSCEEDIEPFFMSQLKACGVEYFDYYLMHAQNRKNVLHFDRCKAYEKAVELKNRGLIKHIGISFHDSADVLDDILTRHPMVEVVQI